MAEGLNDLKRLCEDNCIIELVKQVAISLQNAASNPWMLHSRGPEPTSVNGRILSVDIGGTLLRVATVRFPGCSYERHAQIPIDPEAKHSSLAEWIANILVELENTQLRAPVCHPPPDSVHEPVAVAVAFPLLDGKVVAMGKGFSAQWVGQDVKYLLNQALAGVQSRFRVVSVIHDGAASLLAQRAIDSRCKLSLTWGTGININYLALDGQLVNTEISMLGQQGFGQNTFPLARCDLSRLQHRGFPLLQPLEGIVGGQYLSELLYDHMREQDHNDQAIWRILDAGPTAPLYESAQLIARRAAAYVTAVLFAVAIHSRQPNPVTLCYTGGVINYPFVFQCVMEFSKVCEKAYGLVLRLRPELQGPEIGASIFALEALATNKFTV